MSRTHSGWMGRWPGPLSPPNDPVDAVQRKLGDGAEQGLDRQESNRSWHLNKLGDAPGVRRVLYRDSLPDVWRPRYPRRDLRQSTDSLREDLEDKPLGLDHYLEYAPDVAFADRILEQ